MNQHFQFLCKGFQILAFCSTLTGMNIAASEVIADSSKLPVHRLGASCDLFWSNGGIPLSEENDHLHQELANSLIDLVAFAERYQGQAAYVELLIEATSSSGYCRMFDEHLEESLPEGVESSDIDIKYGIRALTEGERERQPLSLWARAGAGSVSVILPDFSSVPADGLFTTNRHGNFYTFKGPVVAHYFSGNGFETAEFIPIQDSHFFWREISEIRNKLVDDQVQTMELFFRLPSDEQCPEDGCM